MQQVPLPERIRPEKLSDYVGQEHLVGRNGIIRKLLSAAANTAFFPSLIFWGPPGSGKTTLARIIAEKLNRPFYEFSAVSTSIKDIEKAIREQKNEGSDAPLLIQNKSPIKSHQSPIIFIDEIHRFNKAQQDKLLPHIEKGDIVMIGATTENPSFEVIGPLLSRTRVLTLKRLEEENLNKIISRGLKTLNKEIAKDAMQFLQEASNGDARVALNVLEIAASLSVKNKLVLNDIELALQRRQLSFDKFGDEAYNTISAFIKSMRAGNVDSALYYLSRMVEAGQDPLYIARRMVIFASEDIGMAQPTALVVANSVFRACETIGYPECAINLAHGTVYLAMAKKNRSAYDGLRSAQEDVKRYGNLPIPKEILNAPTDLMKDLGYGESYEAYTDKDLLPDKLKGKKYYRG